MTILGEMKMPSTDSWCAKAMACTRTVMGIVVVVYTMVLMGAVASDVCAPACPIGSAGNLTVNYAVNYTINYTVNPSNCTQYYACENVDGQVLPIGPFLCPSYEYFDNTMQECLPISYAPLGYCTTPCNPCDSICDIPGSVLPNPLNCSSYYVCLITGELLNLDCDPGQQFDYSVLECIDGGEDDVNCFTFCEECETYCSEAEETQPDPLDCSSYYICEPPYKVHKVCPDEQIFDPDLGECSASAFCDDSCFLY